MNTWDSLINPEEIADTVSFYNEKVGESRHVTAETAIKVVSQAFNYYDYLEDEERADAIRYDLQSFCEYATTAFNSEDDLSFSDRYTSLLASGHPYSLKVDRSALADWIAGAPELTYSGKSAIVAALNPYSDLEVVRHANIRLTIMAQNSELSLNTMYLLEEALRS